MDTKFKDSVDIDALQSASKITIKFMEDQHWDKVGADLLKALTEKFDDLLNQGVAPEEIMLTSSEWADLVSPKDDQEQASKYIRGHLKTLNKFLSENKGDVDALLCRSALNERLVVKDTGSRGGKKNHYFLGLEPIETAESLGGIAGNVEVNSSIEYKLRRMVKPPFWSRPFLEFRLKSIRGSALLLSPFIGGLFLFWLANTFYQGLTAALLLLPIILLAALAIWALFPLYQVAEKRVVSAPTWLLGWDDFSAQIDMLEIDEQGWLGNKDKKLRVVVYEGECPICKCRVSVVDGSREQKGRLVGKCSLAPEEHVFSFDHITKAGFPLRNTADYIRQLLIKK